MINNLSRCDWGSSDPLLMHYHDTEWGVPEHNDQRLFEFLALDCFQAGLSWLTILKKRDNFRKVFDNFKISSVAVYDNRKVIKLLDTPGIIRNKQKISATINNAEKIMEIIDKFGSFDKYIWKFTNYKTKLNHWKSIREIPPVSYESDEMSKDLKRHGFKFIGSTVCYAFMQSAGMVNDHVIDCFRYSQVLTVNSISNRAIQQ